MSNQIEIIGVKGIPMIKPGDDLASIICEAAAAQKNPFLDGDVVVVTQKIVSKAEGRIYLLKSVKPSNIAKRIASWTHKQPELIELILRDSKSIVRLENGHLITETRHGWICANAGVDVSNVSGGECVTLLPLNPDRSAKRIRKKIEEFSEKKVAVIISDTFGRPFRLGHIDVAIGSSGISPTLDFRGTKDLFGYVLRVKQTAIIDELASAAELVIGNAVEGVPVAIIRGYRFPENDSAGAKILVMPQKRNLFY